MPRVPSSVAVVRRATGAVKGSKGPWVRLHVNLYGRSGGSREKLRRSVSSADWRPTFYPKDLTFVNSWVGRWVFGI